MTKRDERATEIETGFSTEDVYRALQGLGSSPEDRKRFVDRMMAMLKHSARVVKVPAKRPFQRNPDKS